MDIKQHALDLVDSNRPWKSLPNGLNPPPCFTEASCIFTDRHQVRITSLLPIRKKDLVALIEDPKNDICFDPFIQSITCDSDGVYHVHNMVPTSSPIPKKFRLQILNINGAFMGIRYDCVPSTVFMSVMRITSRFEGSVFEIFFEFSPECNSVESFNVLAVNLLRKYVDSVVEYIKGDDEAKQFFEMERDLYKIFNADKKKFPILFHENNMLRILLTEDCCELLLQGEFHSLRDLVDIISWYSCNESLSVLFPISHVVKTTNRFHFHHKETWLFGEKATMDLIFGFKISDGSGVVCYSSTNEIPSDGNPNKIYVNGGSFVSVAENDKIVRYVCHLQLPFFKNFTPKRRRVALNNIATILLSFHAFSCTLQPFQVPFDPSLLTPNETMSHLLQNIYRMNTRKKKKLFLHNHLKLLFLNLSNEILLHVFTFVTPTEIINLSTTCRRINNLLKSNLSKQLYHVLFTKFFDVHAFDSRFESITPTIDEVRSKFYNFASSFRSQKVERKPKLISIGQSVDNVVVLSSGIACSSGKKLLRLNFDGTSQKNAKYGTYFVTFKRSY
ncbi:F-box domain containing protein [Entamoeba marina]